MLKPYPLFQVAVSTLDSEFESEHYFEKLPTPEQLIEVLTLRSVSLREEASLEAVPMASDAFDDADLNDDFVEVARHIKGMAEPHKDNLCSEQIVKVAGRLPVGRVTVRYVNVFRE